MNLITTFLRGITTGPFHNILQLLSLGPDRLVYSVALLAFVVLLNDLIRTALMTEYSRSVLAHVMICIGTLWPGIMLGFVLLYAGYRYPHRVWINLALAVALYIFWWLGGTLTRLARQDTEGADVGWMSHGLIITVVLGLAAAVIG